MKTIRLPRTPTGLRAELLAVIEILKASAVDVTSDYYIARAVGRVEAAIDELFDLAMAKHDPAATDRAEWLNPPKQ